MWQPHFPANQSSAAFLFCVGNLYSPCHLPYCLRVEWFCVFFSLSFHSFTQCSFSFVCMCVCLCACLWMHVRTHDWESSGFQTDVQWQHLIWASEPHMSLVSTCAGYSSPLLFVSFFFLIYLSQTLQAVAVGWQAARASILLKKIGKSGSSLLFRTRLPKHSTIAATHCQPPLPYTI